jgi:hypothetical protein
MPGAVRSDEAILSRGCAAAVVISWRSPALARDAFGGLPRYDRNDGIISLNQDFPEQ